MNNKTELRAAAARLLYNDNRDTSDYNMLIDFIDNFFDNQQPQTGWIPVSERLPEEDGKYLCTTRHGEVHILRFSNDLYSVDKHFFEQYKDKNKKGFHMDWRIEIINLKAWMPLPQPYKESEEE